MAFQEILEEVMRKKAFQQKPPNTEDLLDQLLLAMSGGSGNELDTGILVGDNPYF